MISGNSIWRKLRIRPELRKQRGISGKNVLMDRRGLHSLMPEMASRSCPVTQCFGQQGTIGQKAHCLPLTITGIMQGAW
jgi:hypothetical protein